MRVIVDAHAYQRFCQRFRLHFARTIFEDKHNTIYTIKYLFSKSVRSDFHYKTNRAQYNMMCVKHGHPHIEYTYNDLIKFICVEDDKCLHIRTVWSLQNKN